MMTEKGQELVDGEEQKSLDAHARERLRLEVCEKGSRLLWEWANDPDVRAVSFSTKPISWDQHAEWFKSRLGDPNCVFYLAVNVDSRPIGSIRYEIKGTDAVASINLDREFRRQGYGSQLIQMGGERLFSLRGIKIIHAHIKHGNQASIKAFLRAGFKDMGNAAIDGHDATRLVWQKEQQS
jgi:RimJ/RimL family protein N-acetyltransferase